MVTVAQLAERWIVVPNVVGSSPISHPKTSEISEVFFLFAVCRLPSAVNRQPSTVSRRGRVNLQARNQYKLKIEAYTLGAGILTKSTRELS